MCGDGGINYKLYWKHHREGCQRPGASALEHNNAPASEAEQNSAPASEAAAQEPLHIANAVQVLTSKTHRYGRIDSNFLLGHDIN